MKIADWLWNLCLYILAAVWCVWMLYLAISKFSP
jgi:hypothetical protein